MKEEAAIYQGEVARNNKIQICLRMLQAGVKAAYGTNSGDLIAFLLMGFFYFQVILYGLMKINNEIGNNFLLLILQIRIFYIHLSCCIAKD